MENQIVNFWDIHGLFFIFFMCFFPRLTLLFATVWGGFLWWLGLIFVPRITVAILATLTYWNTNPIIVIFAWIWALAGETIEKTIVGKKSSKA